MSWAIWFKFRLSPHLHLFVYRQPKKRARSPRARKKKSELAQRALNLFWGDDDDTLNSFVELTIQKRIEDLWYADVLKECRLGDLSAESYNFLHGLPTEHAGSWRKDCTLDCGSENCISLPLIWKAMREKDHSWEDMQALECGVCKAERGRSTCLIANDDARVEAEPFVSAP